MAMMDILAYGEDALTLWAITKKLPTILQALDDQTDPSQCQVLFRPSFGRSGGPKSSQFGEFDFIVLASQRLYLGESKWQHSSEKVVAGVMTLREEQLNRHRLFKFYVEEWALGDYTDWNKFQAEAPSKLKTLGITKPIAPAGSLLAANLQTVLGTIQKHFPSMPEVQNVLLFLHRGPSTLSFPAEAGDDFKVVLLDYAEVAENNFLRLSL